LGRAAAPAVGRALAADGRLRELAASLAAARPLLGALVAPFVDQRLHDRVGYGSLGDYGRECLGVGARTLREWARVGRALAGLPLLRGAVVSGELSWTVARLVAGLATPETEAACLASVRGRTVRAVAAIVSAVREVSGLAADPDAQEPDGEERVRVWVPCTRSEATLWYAAVELARRVAGEALCDWQCAERVAAEAASAIGGPAPGEPPGGDDPPVAGSAGAGGGPAAPEHGLREEAFPGLSWQSPARELAPELAELGRDLESCSPRELDRRLRAAVAWLQAVDFETGGWLRVVRDLRLFAELGFASFERYVEERLDLSPRTARRLVALARTGRRAPAAATAFRAGHIHAFQALAVVRVATTPASAEAWVARARAVTLRRLEDEVEARERDVRTAIAFRAPPAVADFFLAMLARAGSLERLLAHAIQTWVLHGEAFSDYADFTRDGFRCAVPGCTGRRDLHSHHLWMRSHQGPDVPWNRITLCWVHHRRGVHGGNLRIQGFAPDQLVFELGAESPERFASGDVRILGDAPDPGDENAR
jgi:hypothetical protein